MAKKVLKQLYPSLLQCLPGKELGNYLYAKDLLMQNELEMLSVHKVLKDQNEVMINALQRRGPDNVLDVLIECLDEVGSCSNIIEEIQCKQKEISTSCEYLTVCCAMCIQYTKYCLLCYVLLLSCMIQSIEI